MIQESQKYSEDMNTFNFGNKQILDSCDGDNVIAWHVMHQITGRIYDEYHLESAKIYRDFYQEILHWNDRRRDTAESVIGILPRIHGFNS